MNYMQQSLKQALSQRQKRRIVDDSRVRSAVLLPLYCKQGQCYILFIKRTERVKTHKSQISFPGGACEDRDNTPADTAMRECFEEIGLVPQGVELLGELDDIATSTSNYIISPFVAVIPWPQSLKVDQWETEEIIEVPIAALLDKGSRHRGTEIIDGEVVTSYSYHYQGRVIWGATARILKQFLDIYTHLTENKPRSGC